MQALDDAGAEASGFNELLNARVAHAHQGKLRSSEKRVGCHQEQDQQDPEQHKSDHGCVILTFQRGLAARTLDKRSRAGFLIQGLKTKSAMIPPSISSSTLPSTGPLEKSEHPELTLFASPGSNCW